MTIAIAIAAGVYASVGLISGMVHSVNVGSYHPNNTHRKAAAIVLLWPLILTRAAMEGLAEYRDESRDRRLERMRKESDRIDKEIQKLERIK